MKLYIKEKVFSWGDRFTVKDVYGNDRYTVQGKVLSLGKKLHVFDNDGREVAFIKQELLSLLPKFYVYCNDRQVAEIRKEFTFLKPRYTISGLGWEINGNFWEHDYEVTQGGETIVRIRKEWMTWGDTYELDIADPDDEIIALAVVLTIDCVNEANSGANASLSGN